MEEKVNPGIFHIHIDGTTIPDKLNRDARRFGFEYSNFGGHPYGFRHFEPNNHLTFKCETGYEFAEVWNWIKLAAEKMEWKGYLEGEYIQTDELLQYHQFQEGLQFPFAISRRRLREDEIFRETELHLTLDKDRSDSGLISNLLNAGLYGAYLPKADHTALVLTAQGYKKDIHPLMDLLRAYINESGGAYRCTLKEEKAIRHKKFNIKVDELPEIVDSFRLQ